MSKRSKTASKRGQREIGSQPGELDAAHLDQATGGKGTGTIEVTDYGFGVSAPVTTSRSDGGGATVGRAN